jgi:hypothetical protein
MKSYNTIYYLLTVMLILGGFASMAQNDYGMLILSGVSIAFGLIFLVQLIQTFQSGKVSDRVLRLEIFALFLLAVLFTLRTFQIYIPFSEWIFAVSGLALALIYFNRMIRHYRQYASKNKILALLVAVFYLSIVVFFLAMMMTSFNPGLVKITGGIACILILGAVLFSLFNGNFLVVGEKTTAVKTISGFRDRYFLLISLFILFAIYVGFTGSGVLPKLYSDKYPQAYYQLVNRAESGKEKPVDGRFEYETFRKNYEQLLEKNLRKEAE